MTYGWAILIIVIVAVILYSMGIFNPSSAITTTSSGFSPFAVSSVICDQANLIVAVTAGGLPNSATSAKITAVYFSSNTGTTASTGKLYNIAPVTLTSGSSTTFIVPTVTCTSAGTAFSLSARMQYSYSTPAGNVVTNTTGTIAGTSSSLKITAYVPLTITSSAATPSPFQQMVVVNMSNYKSYASPTLNNIEFTYPNGTVISSWRENGTTNSQTVVYWLKLGSFTSATVRMDFFSIGENVLNTVNTGEAPQLSSTYGEYDNGANVFNFYDNFKGTNLNTNTWATTNAGGTISQNNGLSIAMSSNWGTFVASKNTFTAPLTVGSSYESTGFPGGGGIDASASLIFTTSSSIGVSSYACAMWQNGGGPEMNFVSNYENGVFPWNSVSSIKSISPNLFYNCYFGINSSGDLAFGYINHLSYGATSTAQAETTGYIALQQTQYGGIWQYVYTAAYPPSGVMPSVTFGSVS